MAKSKPLISVDMVSDIVCPWCWLGKRYFDAARAQFKSAQIDLTFRPYMLDPTVSIEGVPYGDYMRAKFGGGPSDRFKAMREHLERAAPDAGIDFRFSDIPTRPNTLRAHSLLRWAQNDDKGDAVKEALFKAFFSDLSDIGDIAVLSDIAAQAGMDGELVGALLTESRDAVEVQKEIEFFRNLGVTGVPFFIYNGQHAVQGAQPPEAHIDVMKKLINA